MAHTEDRRALADLELILADAWPRLTVRDGRIHAGERPPAPTVTVPTCGVAA